jgi:hypothetical protein
MGVANYGAAATCLGVSRGCAVHRDADKVLAVVEEQIAVFGLAEPDSIFDDCIENRIPGRFLRESSWPRPGGQLHERASARERRGLQRFHACMGNESSLPRAGRRPSGRLRVGPAHPVRRGLRRPLCSSVPHS